MSGLVDAGLLHKQFTNLQFVFKKKCLNDFVNGTDFAKYKIISDKNIFEEAFNKIKDLLPSNLLKIDPSNKDDETKNKENFEIVINGIEYKINLNEYTTSNNGVTNPIISLAGELTEIASSKLSNSEFCDNASECQLNNINLLKVKNIKNPSCEITPVTTPTTTTTETPATSGGKKKQRKSKRRNSKKSRKSRRQKQRK